MIFLDHHEQTQPCAPALESFKRALEEPSAMGSRLSIVRDLVGAEEEDSFVFTSSGPEALNQVFWSVFLEVAHKEGKTHFITSCIEDAPTMQMFKRLEEMGCFVKILPVTPSGEIDLSQLDAMIGPRTALLSLSFANGLTGVIQPIEEAARIAKEKGILFHLEASSAIGKIHFAFSEIGADYLTFSGDKLHSTPVSGALFAKKKAPLVPLILGGKGLRGGPFDFPSFMAFSTAAAQSSLSLDRMSLEIARLRNLFESEVVKLLPDAEVLFQKKLRLPNTTAIAFPKVHQEALLYFLSRKNVSASIGGSYSPHLHRMLIASNIPAELAESAVSFSLSRMTTEEEVRKAASHVGDAVHRLRKISEGT